MRTREEITEDIINAMHDSAATVNDVLKLCSELTNTERPTCANCRHYASAIYTRIAGVNIPTELNYCRFFDKCLTDGAGYCSNMERRPEE